MARSLNSNALEYAWTRSEESLADGDLLPSGWTRRRFLEALGIAGGGIGLGGVVPRPARGSLSRSLWPKRSSSDARVAIVGGGLAGTVAAARLRQAGMDVTVYEADTRVGGRTWTIRGVFDEGQIAEGYAEFINTYHGTMIRLTDEAGLDLENLYAGSPPDLKTIVDIHGEPYPIREVVRDLVPVVAAATRDRLLTGGDTTFYRSNRFGRSLDRMSVSEWIDSRVPGGTGSRVGTALESFHRSEYGMEPAELSALNIVYEFSAVARARRRSPIGLDGRAGPLTLYHIKGGNDLLAQTIADQLEDRIELGHQLVAASTAGDQVRLVFDTAGGTFETEVDRVVMAIPFPVLREVDTADLEMRPEKRRAIAELGTGTNGKMSLQFEDRHWWSLGRDGDILTDRDLQATWDASAVQPGTAGLLVDFVGGEIGRSFGEGTPEERAQLFLDDVEPLLPDLTERWNGRVFRVHPTDSPLRRGSYPAYATGQYSGIRGLEQEAEGNVHFAGDHTSLRFQGYMEGAAESGERVAGEIAAALRRAGVGPKRARRR